MGDFRSRRGARAIQNMPPTPWARAGETRGATQPGGWTGADTRGMGQGGPGTCAGVVVGSMLVGVLAYSAPAKYTILKESTASGTALLKCVAATDFASKGTYFQCYHRLCFYPFLLGVLPKRAATGRRRRGVKVYKIDVEDAEFNRVKARRHRLHVKAAAENLSQARPDWESKRLSHCHLPEISKRASHCLAPRNEQTTYSVSLGIAIKGAHSAGYLLNQTVERNTRFSFLSRARVELQLSHLTSTTKR